jgi:hypothetical protein
VTALGIFDKRPAAAKFNIVRMRANCQYGCFLHGVPFKCVYHFLGFIRIKKLLGNIAVGVME